MTQMPCLVLYSPSVAPGSSDIAFSQQARFALIPDPHDSVPQLGITQPKPNTGRYLIIDNLNSNTG